VKFAEAHAATTIAALRAMPATTFIAPTVAKGNAVPPVSPVDDGWVLPMVAPSRQVPVMVGFTADDIGTGGQGFGPPTAATVATYTSEAEKTYGDQARNFLDLYPAQTDADVPVARKAAGRDRARVAMDLWAADQVRASGTVHTYYFDRVTPWPEHPEFGAHHTSEVPYVFRTVGRGKRAWEPADTVVSDRMSAYFVNFAKTGDPNGAGLPRWPAFTPDAHQTMRLGETAAPMPVADPIRRVFHARQVEPAPTSAAAVAGDLWTIGIHTGPSPFRLSAPAGVTQPVLTGAHVTDMPDLHIDTVAHPNLVLANGRYYMFFTAKDLKVNKGGIGLAESADGLRWTFRKTVIRESFVLADPYVFEWKGTYYMVPEAYTETTVRLYRATSFPDRWEYVQDLVKGGPDDHFISPTLLRHEGRWYLFASPPGNDTLRLFHAADLTGPWSEHPLSPVVRKDPHTARPAGRPFTVDGVVYRVAQDCAPTYGLQVFATRITALSTTAYAEEKVEAPLIKASGAGWMRKAAHHVDAHQRGSGDWIAAVDALGLVPPAALPGPRR